MTKRKGEQQSSADRSATQTGTHRGPPAVRTALGVILRSAFFSVRFDAVCFFHKSARVLERETPEVMKNLVRGGFGPVQAFSFQRF